MALVEFAPLRIPFYRRIQTLAVILYYYSFYFGAFLGAATLLLILFSSYYPLALLYLAWAYFYDSTTPSHGGRRSKFMRSLKIWKHFRDYFPITMRKTVDLNPEHNYIFGYHPHGILCAGAFCCFATEATDFNKTFPGITPHLLPLMGKIRCATVKCCVIYFLFFFWLLLNCKSRCGTRLKSLQIARGKTFCLINNRSIVSCCFSKIFQYGRGILTTPPSSKLKWVCSHHCDYNFLVHNGTNVVETLYYNP